MSKKLYKVEVALNLYVMATSDEDAIMLAKKHLPEDREIADYTPAEVMRSSQIEPDAMDSTPWGADKNSDRVQDFIPKSNEA